MNWNSQILMYYVAFMFYDSYNFQYVKMYIQNTSTYVKRLCYILHAGGEKDEVQVSFPDQCTPTTEDQISPTGTLLRPHQFLEEMNHKHPGHTRSGHGYRAGNSFSSNAKK